jgi:hypothetical protein
MVEPRPIRLAPSAALKERRLKTLLAGRDERDPPVAEAVNDAQLLGSLELAGSGVSWEQVTASRRGEDAPEAIEALRRAQAVVDERAPLTAAAVLSWHAAATGSSAGFRIAPRDRPGGPPPSPPEFIRARLESLEHWLAVDSGRELSAAQQGALALARLVEILPFDDANGRVSRLAASHLMLRAGARAPILVGGDRPRLEQCLQAAFQLSTEPLVALLEEASERAIDVAIQTLEG